MSLHRGWHERVKRDTWGLDPESIAQNQAALAGLAEISG